MQINTVTRVSTVYSDAGLYHSQYAQPLCRVGADVDVIVAALKDLGRHNETKRALELGGGDSSITAKLLELTVPGLEVIRTDARFDHVDVTAPDTDLVDSPVDLIFATDYFLSIVSPGFPSQPICTASYVQYVDMFRNIYNALKPGGVAILAKMAEFESDLGVPVELPVVGVMGTDWYPSLTDGDIHSYFQYDDCRADATRSQYMLFHDQTTGEYTQVEQPTIYFLPSDSFFAEAAAAAGLPDVLFAQADTSSHYGSLDFTLNWLTGHDGKSTHLVLWKA